MDCEIGSSSNSHSQSYREAIPHLHEVSRNSCPLASVQIWFSVLQVWKGVNFILVCFDYVQYYWAACVECRSSYVQEKVMFLRHTFVWTQWAWLLLGTCSASRAGMAEPQHTHSGKKWIQKQSEEQKLRRGCCTVRITVKEEASCSSFLYWYRDKLNNNMNLPL